MSLSLSSLMREHGDVSWFPKAACKGADQRLFYPEGQGEKATGAKQVCNGCSVRLDCLDYALRHRITVGVWGGLSERERRKVARQRRPVPCERDKCENEFVPSNGLQKYCSRACSQLVKNERARADGSQRRRLQDRKAGLV